MSEPLWRHPRQPYELAYILKNDRTDAYQEYAAALRDTMVALEDKISEMQAQIDALWVAAGL
jgi:prefoldin subunit 5